jgi:AraC family transcriptional regulator, regulatory protein of adaptative response / DNA-3-methyladenine glycosylase II
MDLDPAACYRAVLARDARYDGRFFTCVKTTGIYCRPICPARPPKLEHCRFVPTAAAAQEAGFRPCLRCRPESSPDLDAWRGTAATVSRALRLIEGGALDDGGDVASLAERLEVGERHLRRLFRQHLGAAPITVAQTRRVLLAKQLIHQSRLSMIQVALASGFGSVRRFNETFQQLYRRPPGSLRRKRAGARSPESPEISLLLPYRPPYDWSTMIRFLERRAIAGVEIVAGDRYSRTIQLENATGSITVAHEGQHSALRAIVRFPELSALPTIVARIRRMFDLSADPGAIAAVLSADPVLKPLLTERPGLRVPGGWDAFETAVRALLGQQITVASATQLAGRLVAALGAAVVTPAPIDGLTHAFPRPEQFGVADLSSGMPKTRAAALRDIAIAAARDPHLFDPRDDLGNTIARLRELPGIGEWTAQYIAMRGLGESDAFLADDVGVLTKFAACHGRGFTPIELLRRAEAWRPWRAYAVMHLWMADAPTPPRQNRSRKSKEIRHAVTA